MYERSLRASREAWRADPAASAPVRHDTAAPGVVQDDEAAGVRVDAPDVRAIPKIADLQARHAAAALVAWRTNPGDGVRAPGKR